MHLHTQWRAILLLSEVRAKVNNPAGLNLRRSAGLDRYVLVSIPNNTELIVFTELQDTADGFDWIGAKYGEHLGFVAKRFVTLLSNPVPLKTKLHVGLHFAFSGNVEQSTLDVIASMSDEGYPPPAVLICSDPGLCKTIKEIDSSILVCYRWVGSAEDPFPMSGDENSIPVNGAIWYEQLMQRHSQATHADLHQLHNEITFAGNTQSVEYAKRFNTFCMQMMTRATRDGKRVTFGNFMPGVPEEKHINAMAESFAYAEANGHWLCYHPYTANTADESYFSLDPKSGQPTTPYFGLRPVEWVKPFPRLNVLGGEAAHYNSPRYRGTDDFMTIVDELQTMVAPYNTDQRRWLPLLWTLRGKNDISWKLDDFSSAMYHYQARARRIVGL